MLQFRKVLAILMVLLMVCGIVACNSGKKEETDTPAVETPEVDDTGDQTAEEEPEPEDTRKFPADPETRKLDNNKVVMWNGGFNNESNEVLRCEEGSGVDIDYAIPHSEYEDLFTAVASGTAPDALFVHLGRVRELAAMNIIRPLDEFAEYFGDTFDNYEEWIVDTLKVEDSYYAFPWDVGTNELMCYNQALFREAGLDPNAPPTNWDDFYEMAKKLTKYDSAGNLTQIGFYGNIWNHLIKQDGEGGFLSNDLKTMQANRESVIEALELQKKFYDLIGGFEVQRELPDFNLWGNGNVAIQPTHGVWGLYGSIIEHGDVEWESFPMPTKDPNNNNKFEISATWALVLPNNSKNPVGGYVAAQWFAENGILMINELGFERDPAQYCPRFSASKIAQEAIMSDFVSTMPEHARERISDILDSYDKYSFPVNPNPVQDQLDQKIRKIMEEEMWSGKISVREAVQKIDEECQPILDKYWEKFHIIKGDN